MNFPLWLQAGFWGFVAGSALLLGALLGYGFNLPQRLTAGVMAFGSGVLISALSFELMDEAYHKGSFFSVSVGFVLGAGIYTLANAVLAAQGAKNRKRSSNRHDHRQPTEVENSGSGMAIALGSLLDGIPESIVIGVSMITGGKVSFVTVIAIFLSNIPEGLSSTSGMKKSGRSRRYIFGLWGAICLASAISAVLGYSVFSQFSNEIISATTAVAAGAVLTMIVDTMIPEAFEHTHNFAGLITVAGFLASFILSKLG